MRDATGDTRRCRISGAAGSGQRATGSMREALYSTASAHHGTDAIHKVHHTTGAAACSYTHESARGKTKEVRRLAHLGALSGSLAALDLGRRPHSSLSAKVAPLTSCSRRLRRADSRSFASATSCRFASFSLSLRASRFGLASLGHRISRDRFRRTRMPSFASCTTRQ
jgi:hypothetical protein